MSSTALILVDFENEWLDRSSPYFVGDIERVLHRVNKLIDYSRSKGHSIIFIRHIEKGSKKEFAQKTKATRIIRMLHRQKGDAVVKKYKISAFYKTSLERKLKGIKHLVVCGILTNLCVRSLIHDAYDRDYRITAVKDCCVAFDRETQDFTFKDLAFTRPEIKFCDLRDLP